MIASRTSFLALIAAAGLTAAPASADYTLNILHINDLHSRFEPISKFDGTCSAEDDAAGACFGGVARLKHWLDGRRAALQGQNVLTLSAGDEFQGSLFFTTYKGEATAEFMNELQFDVITVGNHEFDSGPGPLGKFADLSKAPLIAGNMYVADEPALNNKIPGYVIIDVGGEKIGVVGVITPDTAELSSPGPNVSFSDDIRYLQSIVPEIESHGVNKIIVLSHVGIRRDMEIAAQVPGVDVIVGGHSHTYLSATNPSRQGAYPTWASGADGKLVPIVQAGAYGRYVGELQVTFSDDGEVMFAEGDTKLIDSSVAKNEAVDARVKELGAPIQNLLTQRVGETTVPVDGARESCRVQECEMGVLVTEAVRARTAGQGVDMVILNGGGLRASLDAGEVTMGEVLTVLPFQNTVATFQLTGAGVVEALENGVSQIESAAGRFPQVAGLRFSFDPSAPPGSRINSVEVQTGVGYALIDPAKTYTIASNNYMRAGGDGYDVFATQGVNAYDFGPGLDEVLVEYLAANSPYSPRLRNSTFTGTRVGPIIQPQVKPGSGLQPITTLPARIDGRVYQVKSGDTLWKIARAELGDPTRYPEIVELNGLAAGAALTPGQELKMPRR